MKLRMKVNQVVEAVGVKSGKPYTKVKVTVEEGHDQQTGFVFWNSSLGKPPMPGDVVIGDFGLAAGEQGDLMIKLSGYVPEKKAA